MTAQDKGKWFEGKVSDVLKKMMAHEPIYFHRLVDTHSAGRYVQPQPCDFLIASDKVDTIYLELKASTVHDSAKELGADILRPTQIGKAKLIHRAGQAHLTLFYGVETNVLELWLTDDLISGRKDVQPYYTGSFTDLEGLFNKVML